MPTLSLPAIFLTHNTSRVVQGCWLFIRGCGNCYRPVKSSHGRLTLLQAGTVCSDQTHKKLFYEQIYNQCRHFGL